MHTIGMMTGNSMDAADAVLMAVEEGGQCRLLDHNRTIIPPPLADDLKRIAESSQVAIADLLQLQNDITRICAEAASKWQAVTPRPLIGCHGQTIAHRPDSGATCQLLNGALLAVLTGCDVVADFRAHDIALGGQGAPLAPLFHQHFFGEHAPCDIVNIGGICNITHLNAGGEVSGYDIGPGMMLLDAWYQRHHAEESVRYDDGGQLARNGRVDNEVLAQLLAHPYFAKSPPKSCGREAFALEKFADCLQALSPADGQATLAELTARTIAAAVRAPQLILCGGGSRNAFLFERITALCPAAPQLSDAYGCPAELVEAATFAWLAYCHVHRIPIQTQNITGGALHIAGAHYPAPPIKK